MGTLAAQSKYLKHFPSEEKKLHEGETNGRLASPQRYPLNRQFKNGKRRLDEAIKASDCQREQSEVVEEGGANYLIHKSTLKT